jgi:hypothetical protein
MSNHPICSSEGRRDGSDPLGHPIRAALVFIGQFGEQAEARAARIASEWLSAGNDAAAAWLVDVCDAIHELKRTERHPGETVH